MKITKKETMKRSVATSFFLAMWHWANQCIEQAAITKRLNHSSSTNRLQTNKQNATSDIA